MVGTAVATYETGSFTSSGCTLRWFLWRPPVEGPVTYVLLAHGLTNNHDDAPLFAQLRTRLLDDGKAVFAFDFLGSGESEGAFEDKTWDNQRQSITDALEILTEQIASPQDRIAVFGRSVGGTMCGFVSNHPRVSCSVLASPPVNLVDCFGRYLSRAVDGYVHMPADAERSGQIRGEWKLPEEFFEKLSRTEKELKEAATGASHMLVIHGAADPKVHTDNSTDLYQLLSEPRGYLLVEGGDHYYNGREAEVIDAAAIWIDQHTRSTE